MAFVTYLLAISGRRFIRDRIIISLHLATVDDFILIHFLMIHRFSLLGIKIGKI